MFNSNHSIQYVLSSSAGISSSLEVVIRSSKSEMSLNVTQYVLSSSAGISSSLEVVIRSSKSEMSLNSMVS